MNIPLSALVAIRRRIDHAAIPRLFDDRWSARRVRARRDRFDSWLGTEGREIVNDHAYAKGEIPSMTLRRCESYATPKKGNKRRSHADETHA